jgi:hypothetical protein
VRETLRNLLRGLAFGLLMAAGFTVWITVIRITAGNAPFEQTSTPFLTTAFFYFIGFSVGGLLAGGLWSTLHRSAIGWMLMGFVLIAPVYAMFLVVSRTPAQRFSNWNILGTAFGATIVGGLGGLRIWSLRRSGWRERRTDWRLVGTVLIIGGTLALVMYLAWW